jgi:hypothetical protein
VSERAVENRIAASAATWWRAAIVVIGLAGLLSGSNAVEYFTIQTNLLVVAYYIVALAGSRGRTPWTPAPRLRGAMTSYILLTGLAYHFVLQGGSNPIPGLLAAAPGAAIENWSLFLLHYVSPVIVLIDWVAWGPRRRVRWVDGLLWMLYPLGYAFVIIVRGIVLPDVADRYPYPFLDPTVGGWSGVALGILQVTALLAVVIAAVIGLDRIPVRLGNRDRRASTSDERLA